jgi:predicted Zn-dependent peptidase
MLLGCWIPVHGQLKSEDIKTFTLKNGMKFLVSEDSSIPNANMYLFYKVGSRNEYPGITGLSHFFEHVMFNGAKKYGPKSDINLGGQADNPLSVVQLVTKNDDDRINKASVKGD